MSVENMPIAGRVGINPRGEYSESEMYKRLDYVTYDGNGYLARKENIGILPTDNEFWMFAIGGLKGDAGNVTYDNTFSGIEAENVQDAIDEVAQKAIDAADSVPKNVLVAPEESQIPESAPKLNADRLGGELPSYYAPASALGGIMFSITENGRVRASWDDGL